MKTELTFEPYKGSPIMTQNHIYNEAISQGGLLIGYFYQDGHKMKFLPAISTGLFTSEVLREIATRMDHVQASL